jgi:hypothetical protein
MTAEAAESRRVDQELEQAARFRAEGRFGRARVCSRRAAGWAIGPTYRRSTGELPPLNVMTLLRWYCDFAEAAEPLRRAARLTTHVNPEHSCTHAEDPVDDACWSRRCVEAARLRRTEPRRRRNRARRRSTDGRHGPAITPGNAWTRRLRLYWKATPVAGGRLPRGGRFTFLRKEGFRLLVVLFLTVGVVTSLGLALDWMTLPRPTFNRPW